MLTKQRCHSCAETHQVAPCRVCGVSICPAHRWSTGDPKRGFYCVDSFCVPVHGDALSVRPWVDHALPRPQEEVQSAFTTIVVILLGVAIAVTIMVLTHWAYRS